MLTQCQKSGEKHFAVIPGGEDPARYIKSTTINEMLGHVE